MKCERKKLCFMVCGNMCIANSLGSLTCDISVNRMRGRIMVSTSSLLYIRTSNSWIYNSLKREQNI